MATEQLRTLLDHLEGRERISDFDTPMARMRGSLHELEEEDVLDLMTAAVSAATYVSEGDAAGYAISLVTIGLELGRELERRI